MSDLSKKIVRFLLDEDGPTAVEYAVILLLIFLACLTAITVFAQTTATSIESSSNSIDEAFGPQL